MNEIIEVIAVFTALNTIVNTFTMLSAFAVCMYSEDKFKMKKREKLKEEIIKEIRAERSYFEKEEK